MNTESRNKVWIEETKFNVRGPATSYVIRALSLLNYAIMLNQWVDMERYGWTYIQIDDPNSIQVTNVLKDSNGLVVCIVSTMPEPK